MAYSLEDRLEFLRQIHPEIPRLIVIMIAIAIIVIVYKFFSRSLTRAGRRLEWDPHTLNSIRLVLRIIVLFMGVSVTFSVFELPTEWIVGTSALIGAAIGFGSSQTINNIVAGLYVLVSRPFKVTDYVKIGDVEGQVEEISINYTKLYTPSFNLLLLPNVQVMNSRILNCTHEGFIKYTFSLAFPHGVANEIIAGKCIEPAIEEFDRKHEIMKLRRPEYFFETSSNLGRSFKIRIFIPKGDAKTLYLLQPEIADMILNRWDTERKRTT